MRNKLTDPRSLAALVQRQPTRRISQVIATSVLRSLGRRAGANPGTPALVLPWAAFLAMLAWAWRVGDLIHNVPSYSDALEVLWGLDWYWQALTQGQNPLVYPNVFAPQGWQVATLAHSPLLFVSLMPVYALGGAAFALNFTVLLAHVLAYGGMYKLARLRVGPLASTVAALGFTFWYYRWFRTGGHLHTLISTAMLPLMVWAWEQGRRHPAHRRRWVVITGVLWAISITASLYAIWHGAVLLLAWGLAQVVTRRMPWPAAVKSFLTAAVTAFTLSSPTLWLFWRGISVSQTHFYRVEALVAWAASLNSFAIPSLRHPWLQGLARALDSGPRNESELANFGLVGFLAALIGIASVRKDRRFWPLIACSVAGLVLALGPVLKWSGIVLPVGIFQPITRAIWWLGERAKPTLFLQSGPSDAMGLGMPLPGILAAAILPFWEGARITSRFALVAAVGLFPLMSLTVDRLRPTWARVALALVLIFEFMPEPTDNLPATPASHPAFDWLRTQQLAGANIIDLAPAANDHLMPLLSGETLYSTTYHGQSTVSGVGSYMPAQFAFLSDWFMIVVHPLDTPDLTTILRAYNVRYILVHMRSGFEPHVLEESKANAELRFRQCFSPLATKSRTPWNYQICILEVLDPVLPQFNIVRLAGWAPDEPWGTWIEGQQGTGRWVAITDVSQHLEIGLQPVCVTGRPQHVTVAVNGVEVADHQWAGCESWEDDISLPAPLIKLGWNDLTIQADFAD